MRAGQLRAPEYVDDFDRRSDAAQIRVARLAEDLPRARARVHRNDSLPAGLQEARNSVRVTRRVRGAAHDGPRRELLQNLPRAYDAAPASSFRWSCSPSQNSSTIFAQNAGRSSGLRDETR